MKRVISGLLCVCLGLVTLFMFTGCGGKGDLRIISHGVFPPVTFIENGRIAGIEVDLGNIIANEMNKKVRRDIVEFGGIIAALQSGTHDLTICLTPTDARREMLDFTDPYLTFSGMFLARENDTRLDGKNKEQINAELNGRTVGVIFGSTLHTYVSGVSGAIPVHYENVSLMIAALKNSQVDFILWEFMVTDGGLAPNLTAVNTGIKIIKVPVSANPIAMAVKKGNTALLNKVNAILVEVKRDGRLDEIVAKYI